MKGKVSNKEKKRRYDKKYYEINRDKILERTRDYYNKNKEKEKQRKHKYYIENKDKLLEKTKIYKEENKEKKRKYQADYYKRNKDNILLNAKKYRNTKKGKITNSKNINKRRRNLGFEPLLENIFEENIEIDWHHITDDVVIALPREIHRRYLGKTHRKKLKSIVEKLYNITYYIEENGGD